MEDESQITHCDKKSNKSQEIDENDLTLQQSRGRRNDSAARFTQNSGKQTKPSSTHDDRELDVQEPGGSQSASGSRRPADNITNPHKRMPDSLASPRGKKRPKIVNTTDIEEDDMYSEKFTGTYSSWKGALNVEDSTTDHTSRKDNPSSSAEQLRDQIRALFQRSNLSATRLGVSLSALASYILPILPHRNFDIWAIKKTATAVQNIAPLPLSESFSPGVAFWNPTVEFARDRFGQFGEHFGPTPQGRVSAKWRLQIVRQVMPGYLLTSIVETNGDRGLYGSHIDASTHWQYLRVADIRDQRPLNHSPHAPLRLDKTGSNTQMRDSSNGYVHAGVIQKCIPVDTWTFAGRLTSESLRMLDALSKEVLTATRGLAWHERHLLNFEAIHRGQFELDHPLPPRDTLISPAQIWPRTPSRYGHEVDAPQGSYQHRFEKSADLPRTHAHTYAQPTGQRLHPAVSAPTSTGRKETNFSPGTQHPSSNPELPLDEQTLRPLPAPIQPVVPKQHTQPTAPVQSAPRNPTDATTRARQSPPASASSDHSQTAHQTSRDGVNLTVRDITSTDTSGTVAHITINMSPSGHHGT